jgi:hypothetical protein
MGAFSRLTSSSPTMAPGAIAGNGACKIRASVKDSGRLVRAGASPIVWSSS